VSVSPRDKSPALAIRSEMVGDKVKVYFQDNGPGIPDAVLSRVLIRFSRPSRWGRGRGWDYLSVMGLWRGMGEAHGWEFWRGQDSAISELA
jgi:hypothetical protein